MRGHILACGLALAVLCGCNGTTRACGLDGIPSLLVDGKLVALNRTPPAQGQVSKWAPFVAPSAYLAGRSVQFSEIRGRVLWTLPPSAFNAPWRWTFGDGAQARGMLVRHAYRHAGTYVIAVRAYLIDGKDSQWYVFDTVVMHVR